MEKPPAGGEGLYRAGPQNRAVLSIDSEDSTVQIPWVTCDERVPLCAPHMSDQPGTKTDFWW